MEWRGMHRTRKTNPRCRVPSSDLERTLHPYSGGLGIPILWALRGG
jgi:hypothetical protein